MSGSVAELQAALDPVLADHGFAPGQGGGLGDDDADVVWCASYVDLQRTHPWLPQATGQDSLREHACVDLIVTFSAGRLERVDFEGVSLQDTFIALDVASAAHRAAGLLSAPVSVAAGELAQLLRVLFQPRGVSAGSIHR